MSELLHSDPMLQELLRVFWVFPSIAYSMLPEARGAPRRSSVDLTTW